MYITDTIAAISTPLGNGGIGIVRVSGPQAEAIGSTIFNSAHNGGFDSHRFYFGRIVEPTTSETVDEAMLVLMRAPRSYTREDVLEIHCHGGALVVERVLGLTLTCGARLAEPGEFTRRAFLNGRIDLLQAEAVMDIIGSRTDAALRLAQHQREGLLSRRINEIRSHLVHGLALIEAYIDFPEDDIGSADYCHIQADCEEGIRLIEELLAGFDDGRMIREGVSILILGKPNAGKSSLLNRLLQENRAIVTHIPGTTRDIIEETLNIGGLPVRLLDTAGIRHTDDIVEQEGINRAIARIPQADMVLAVLDASRPFEAEDNLIMESVAGTRTLLVVNKTDRERQLVLPDVCSGYQRLEISALTGQGIDDLKSAVRSAFLHGSAIDNRDLACISRVRHRDALLRAADVLRLVLAGLAQQKDLELLSVDLRDALAAVGTVTGQTAPDEILDHIFSSFCIGK